MDRVIKLYPEKSYARYEAEIVREGEVLSRIPVAASPGAQIVSLLIPGGTLEPGKYHVRLYGIEAGRREEPVNATFEVDGP
jgi:hypothetical protein